MNIVAISALAVAAALEASQVAKLLASDGASGDYFGSSTAVYESMIIVGAFRDDNSNGQDTGAAYVFNATTQVAKLVSGESSDFFGWSVSIFNSTIVAGAYDDDDLGSDAGAVYVFEGSSFVQTAKLTASDGQAGGRFGYAVSVYDGTVAVGAPGVSSHVGAAYVFDNHAERCRLNASDGQVDNVFGSAIAIYENVTVVGAYRDGQNDTGAAYVFEGCVEVAKLTASDADNNDYFGDAVAIYNRTIVVGVRYDDDIGTNAGAVYVFDYEDGAYALSAKLTASDGEPKNKFGYSVAIFDGAIIAGATRVNNAGAAYVFEYADGSYVQRTVLNASDTAKDDYFGCSCGVYDGLVVVGACGDADLGYEAGSAYVFEIVPSPTATPSTAAPSLSPLPSEATFRPSSIPTPFPTPLPSAETYLLGTTSPSASPTRVPSLHLTAIPSRGSTAAPTSYPEVPPTCCAVDASVGVTQNGAYFGSHNITIGLTHRVADDQSPFGVAHVRSHSTTDDNTVGLAHCGTDQLSLLGAPYVRTLGATICIAQRGADNNMSVSVAHVLAHPVSDNVSFGLANRSANQLSRDVTHSRPCCAVEVSVSVTHNGAISGSDKVTVGLTHRVADYQSPLSVAHIRSHSATDDNTIGITQCGTDQLSLGATYVRSLSNSITIRIAQHGADIITRSVACIYDFSAPDNISFGLANHSANQLSLGITHTSDDNTIGLAYFDTSQLSLGAAHVRSLSNSISIRIAQRHAKIISLSASYIVDVSAPDNIPFGLANHSVNQLSLGITHTSDDNTIGLAYFGTSQLPLGAAHVRSLSNSISIRIAQHGADIITRSVACIYDFSAPDNISFGLANHSANQLSLGITHTSDDNTIGLAYVGTSQLSLGATYVRALFNSISIRIAQHGADIITRSVGCIYDFSAPDNISFGLANHSANQLSLGITHSEARFASDNVTFEIP
ncbi:hypothetical protein CTAYLR_009192 [Chrysophaeum taylorii]|uniref:FG-GAP repeat protein n=1 Tax=Chrysophaeum taylorii TaxID=2483200 RepID=A0AAD7ULH7_9STRA|nr:hypothetical protein CTAYLR_009192 [Chrysophaeum taylorii]